MLVHYCLSFVHPSIWATSQLPIWPAIDGSGSVICDGIGCEIGDGICRRMYDGSCSGICDGICGDICDIVFYDF